MDSLSDSLSTLPDLPLSPKALICSITLVSSSAFPPPAAFVQRRALEEPEGRSVRSSVYPPSPLKVAPGGFPPLEVTASREESSPCSLAGFQTHFLPSPLSPRSDTGCAGCFYLQGLPQTLPTYL